ncbi:glycine receptor subunit alpha-2-like [Mytilus galloprovincialis]|uniref:glycine receptor subunit alpha-2-like n=1 Tax=Mytilus galloprovincialis TaxID=29158 RepID=UPI003F7CD14B
MYLIVLFVSNFGFICGASLEQFTLDSMLNSSYDQRVPPGVDYGKLEESQATIVTVFLDFSQIFDINEGEMDFSVTLDLFQEWTDHRLNFEDSSLEQIQLDQKDIKKVWTPDTFFLQAKNGKLLDISKANTYLHIMKNGSVIYAMRLSLKLSCSMDFHLYPLDKQECKVVIESFGLTLDRLQYAWRERKPVNIQHFNLPLYQILGPKTSVSTNYHDLTASEYSDLEVTIEFHRAIGYYMTEVFIPDVLIVLLSWVTFWLHPDAVPARVSLGAVTVLTISSQGSAARRYAPKVSYIKAIDIWSLCHILFVFGAMVEFSVVNVLSRKKRPIIEEMFFKSSNNKKIETQDPRPFMKEAKRIDFISRFAFPVVYIIFNILFWIVTMYLEY